MRVWLSLCIVHNYITAPSCFHHIAQAAQLECANITTAANARLARIVAELHAAADSKRAVLERSIVDGDVNLELAQASAADIMQV